MARIEELEKLSSKELHDRAVRAALRHLDVQFFWDLLSSIPAAETVAGHPDRASADIVHVSRLLADAMHGDEGELAEALRPLYLDYLLKHEPPGR
jgi:hypothetical protein